MRSSSLQCDIKHDLQNNVFWAKSDCCTFSSQDLEVLRSVLSTSFCDDLHQFRVQPLIFTSNINMKRTISASTDQHRVKGFTYHATVLQLPATQPQTIERTWKSGVGVKIRTLLKSVSLNVKKRLTSGDVYLSTLIFNVISTFFQWISKIP